MPQTAEQLVGRAAELESLDEALSGLEHRRPRMLELAGEPGIGKTRLLAELSARADAQRCLVLSGSASELERELPFWLFVDALDEYVQALEPGRLDYLDDDTRAQLAHVFPSLPGAGAALQHERYLIHRAVRRLLEALAASKPLVLLLDDLHWADSGSIELLGSLLRRPPAAPVLLAFALRPRQVPAHLHGALERAQHAGALTRLELGTLNADDASRLLGEAVSPSVAAAVFQESGGNPFYLEQLARAQRRRLDATPAAADVSLAGVEAPDMVIAALAEELALLGDCARRVLEGAAVAGDPFEPELAAAAAAAPESTVIERLDELLRLDLVRCTDVPRRFRFRHPLVRQAVYEATPGGWRLAAHERAAVALAARGAPATARAHHVEQAGRHGDASAIAILREAGEAVAARTPAGAARWFGAALRLLPADAPADQRIPLLSALASAAAATGQFADAHAALVECIGIVPDEALELRIQLIIGCAGIEQLLGRHHEARSRLAGALEGLPDRSSPAASAIMIALATSAFYSMDFDGSRAWGDRALAAASALGDAPLTAAATATVALSLAFAGASREAADYRAEAAALVDPMSDEELGARLDAIAHLAAAEGYLDRFEESLAHARRGVAVARATGQGQLFPMLILAVNTALFGLGRFTEAAELLDGEIEGARLSGAAQPLTWNLLSSGAVRMMCGDLDAALTAADESVELSRKLDVTVVSSLANVILGLILIERGLPDDGVSALVATGGGDGLTRIPGNWRAWSLERLAQGLLALGRRSDAERAAANAEAAAAASGLPFAAVAAQRARARILEQDGEAGAAAEQALASAAAADRTGAVAEAALSRMLAGRALAQAGERGRAIEELERAATALEACGAIRYRDAAEREIGKLGHRPYRRSGRGKAGSVGVASLTQRELQIARLIVARKTNRQIAAELYVSLKTVETHVRNVFHKLDVSSRVDVARTVESVDRARL